MTTNSPITPELLDQLLANYEKPEDLTGEDGLFKQLKKALIERALGAELTDHLGYEKGDPAGRGSGNNRRVTDAVLDKVRDWQNRPLDPVYPVVFFDALRVKIRDEGLVKNKAVYIALALNADGEKDVLGLWIEQTEGAKFWLKVVNELKARGVNDILIAVVDGLKGFPEAITSV